MENKEIIDGVDVSGCEYCLKMTKYRCSIQRDVYKCLCEENPNCHYKQLARKTAKCENYKQALAEIENYVRDNSNFDKSDELTSTTGAYDILEIINKTKDGE